MIERIIITIEFIFDETEQMFLSVTGTWKNHPLPLALAEFLGLLYTHEKEMHRDDVEFCYSLAKCLKKVTVKGKPYYAIATDLEMALFFKRLLQYDVLTLWREGEWEAPLAINSSFPLTVTVKRHGFGIGCTLEDLPQWRNNPLSWLIFQYGQDKYCFCRGSVFENPPDTLETFLMTFLDKETIIYEREKAEAFFTGIYSPNKTLLVWSLELDPGQFLPQEIVPTPVLDIRYQDNTLHPTLSFSYNGHTVTPDDYSGKVITSSGTIYKRVFTKEAEFQQGLMTLFQQHNLPFLLNSPPDIASFMTQIVPLLTTTGWQIHSNAPDFNVVSDPVDVSFTLSSVRDSSFQSGGMAHMKDSGKDWFYFEPNCTILGQAVSLQEIARLMTENGGYVKTKKGYVRLSENSKQEIRALSQLGMFKVGQKYRENELLPYLTLLNVSGNDEKSRRLTDKIHQLKDMQGCPPSADFKGTLRPYQQYGVNWLHFLYENGFGGILADDMGLGKTVQVLAFSSLLAQSPSVLIVGPTNVLYNWRDEIRKFLPSRKVVVHGGMNRTQDARVLADADFVITSFGVLKNDIALFSSLTFNAFIVDEAQYIKNPAAQISKAVKAVPASFRLALTGTPVENHLSDLWNLFDFVLPDHLGTKRQFDILAQDSQLGHIKTRIKPFVLRRLKQEVLDSLPEKTEIIVRCDLTEEQVTLYQTVLQAAKRGLQDTTGKVNKLNILTSLLKLRQVCLHPALLKEVKGQAFPSAKFDLVKEKISELIDEGHKIVVFSQFTEMLDILGNWLTGEKISYERIDGSVSGKTRQESVRRFQDQTEPGVFMLSLKAGGVGINLTSAGYVLHLDPWWNPAVEAQATDRVHRMGQQQKVIVYKFIATGTIEEQIEQLQGEKRALLAQLVDIDSADEKAISIEDLRQVLLHA